MWPYFLDYSSTSRDEKFRIITLCFLSYKNINTRNKLIVKSFFMTRHNQILCVLGANLFPFKNNIHRDKWKKHFVNKDNIEANYNTV